MAFPRGSQPVYAPASEHKLRQMQALVRAVYSTTAGSTTRGPLTATVAVPKAADARDTAVHGEGEEGEVHEYAEGEGEHGIGHADASGKVAVASGVPLDEHSADHLEAAVKVQDLGEEPHEDVDFVPEPGAALHRPKPKPPLAVDSDDMIKTKDWLRKQRLTKAIAYFVESEVDLESMLELTEDQFEEWLSELPLDTMQKVRLRKGVAKLRVEPKTELVEHSDDERKESEPLLKASAAESSAAPMSAMTALRSAASGFRFDTFTKDMCTDPRFHSFSGDLKSATPKLEGGPSSFILEPLIESGTHELHFFIKSVPWRNLYICVGVRSGFGKLNLDKEMLFGFEHTGQVFTDGHWHKEDGVEVEYDFGGWKKKDHIKLIVDLDNGKASIHSPYGDKTVDFISPFAAHRFYFIFSAKTTLSIV